jgi:4-diphosphocytidyl-2-C-methyl-D-erythritol kinase
MRIHAPAKVNVFLKITGVRGNYHELRSRFVRVDSLCDTLTFTRKQTLSDGFEMVSSTPLPPDNTITRAYELLRGVKPEIEKFFKVHKLILTKKIPQGAGLGGGSSDAAAFLNFCNEACGLRMSPKALATIGEKIGADVPFFVYGYPSANVEGIGEFITPFDEEPPALELRTPPVHCDTGLVYRAFRENFLETVDKDAAKEWLHLPTRTLMQSLDPLEANDLFRAALTVYPSLRRLAGPHCFFSGSGSTFFRLK